MLAEEIGQRGGVRGDARSALAQHFAVLGLEVVWAALRRVGAGGIGAPEVVFLNGQIREDVLHLAADVTTESFRELSLDETDLRARHAEHGHRDRLFNEPGVKGVP